MGPPEGERVEALGLKNRAKAEEARVLKREDSDPLVGLPARGSGEHSKTEPLSPDVFALCIVTSPEQKTKCSTRQSD